MRERVAITFTADWSTWKNGAWWRLLKKIWKTTYRRRRPGWCICFVSLSTPQSYLLGASWSRGTVVQHQHRAAGASFPVDRADGSRAAVATDMALIYTAHSLDILSPHPTVKGPSLCDCERSLPLFRPLCLIIHIYRWVGLCVWGDGWILYNAYTSAAVYHWQIPPGFDMCISEVSGDI